MWFITSNIKSNRDKCKRNLVNNCMLIISRGAMSILMCACIRFSLKIKLRGWKYNTIGTTDTLLRIIVHSINISADYFIVFVMCKCTCNSNRIALWCVTNISLCLIVTDTKAKTTSPSISLTNQLLCTFFNRSRSITCYTYV